MSWLQTHPAFSKGSFGSVCYRPIMHFIRGVLSQSVIDLSSTYVGSLAQSHIISISFSIIVPRPIRRIERGTRESMASFRLSFFLSFYPSVCHSICYPWLHSLFHKLPGVDLLFSQSHYSSKLVSKTLSPTLEHCIIVKSYTQLVLFTISLRRCSVFQTC